MKIPNLISPQAITISGLVHRLYGFPSMHKWSFTQKLILFLKTKHKHTRFINTVLWHAIFILFINGTEILMMNTSVDWIFCYLK